jgi:hypothetical protein
VRPAIALLTLGLSAAAIAGVPGGVSASGERCGSLFAGSDDYVVKVVRGDVSCRKARRLLREFLDNITEGECGNPPTCTSASPPKWKCRNTDRTVGGVRPGVLTKCARGDDEVATVYTGPALPGA